MSKLHDAMLDRDATEQEEMLRADVERELGRAYAASSAANYDPRYQRLYESRNSEQEITKRERELDAIKYRLEEALDRYRHLERMEAAK